jgi:hypothetical protein
VFCCGWPHSPKRYINNETVTAPELLSQWLQDFALEKFKVYEKKARENNLDIRISETNSL